MGQQCLLCSRTRGADAFTRDAARPGGLHPYCKDCRSRERRTRYLTTGDRERAQMRAYASAHSDENRARALAHKRDARQDPAYRKSETAFNREWRRRNPGKVAAANARQRTRGRFDPGWTDGEWQALLDQYGRACLACGATGQLSPDHVIPLSCGGPNDIGNIQPLCPPCNMRKGAQTIDYRPGRTTDQDRAACAG